MGHAMHSIDPALFAATLTEWALTLSRGRGGGATVDRTAKQPQTTAARPRRRRAP